MMTDFYIPAPKRTHLNWRLLSCALGALGLLAILTLGVVFRWWRRGPDVERIVALHKADELSADEAVARLGSVREGVPELVGFRIRRSSIDDHEASVRLLRAYGSAAGSPLLKELQGNDVNRAACAADFLGELGATVKDHASPLAELVAGAELGRGVRWKAARALPKLTREPDIVIPALMKCLDDPHAALPAMIALGQFGPRAAIAVPDLVSLFDSVDSALRFRAARTLGEIGPGAEDAVPGLVKMAGQDVSSVVRKEAAKALVKIRAGQKETLASPPPEE
jgi:HEAT repeat protein